MKNLALFIILLPVASHSCDLSCPDLKTLYFDSEYVFIMDADRVENYGFNLFRDEPKIKVTFSNIKNVKGKWNTSQIKTIQNRYSCQGMGFIEGVKYIAFVNNENDFHFCNTFQYSESLQNEIKAIAEAE